MYSTIRKLALAFLSCFLIASPMMADVTQRIQLKNPLTTGLMATTKIGLAGVIFVAAGIRHWHSVFRQLSPAEKTWVWTGYIGSALLLKSGFEDISKICRNIGTKNRN